MEYAIIFEGDPQRLVSEVNRHIDMGWEPIGGVCVSKDTGMRPVSFCQAIIRKTKADEHI